MYRNLIFDLDDTILTCSKYYEECKDKFVAEAVKRTGVKQEVVEKILGGVDLACMGLDDGFGKERFPRSFAATSAVLDIIRGKPVDEIACDRAFVIGDSVFRAEYPIIEGAEEVLEEYKAKGYNLFLYTKGDYGVQQRKIDIHRLDRFFDMENTYIVGKKGGEQIQKIIDDHNLIKEETVLIGDSMRDDIRSANEVGIDSVHVWDIARRKWDYESTNEFKANTTIPNIKMLPFVFSNPIYMGYTTTETGA